MKKSEADAKAMTSDFAQSGMRTSAADARAGTERLRDEVLNGRGFVLIRGLPVETGRSPRAPRLLGHRHVFRQRALAERRAMCSARARSRLSSKDPNVRIYQTTERQNFHTDSCDIVALLCLKTAKSGGLSSLTSSMTIYNVMATRRPDLRGGCSADADRPARRGARGQASLVRDADLQRSPGLLSAIYAPHYVRSSQRFPDAPRLSAEDIAALDCFDALAEDAELRLDMEFRPGDMQFVHNHTVLHDRTAFEDWPEPERKRHLLRLWLAAPGARPLPPAYAERYGSVEIGNRGGIVCKGTRLHAPLEAV